MHAPFRATTAVSLLLALAGQAAAQSLPEVWSRAADWVDEPSTSHGTTTGNPAADSGGNLVWHYDYAIGGPIGSPNPWYAEPLVPMTWDSSWFSDPGCWSAANDMGCIARDTSALHWILNIGQNHVDFVPVLRWKNATGQSFAAHLVGTLVVSWSGVGGSAEPVDVDLIVALRDGSTGQLTTLLSRTIPKPTQNTVAESVEIPINIPNLQLDPDDELIWTQRGGGPSVVSRWIGLADRICIIRESIGTPFCGPAVPNSTGSASELVAHGSQLVADNRVTLKAFQVPPQTFGFFITSRTQGFVPNPAGSTGNLCLGGSIGRFVGPGQIQQSDHSRMVSLPLDLTQHPTPGNGLIQVLPGDTWSFQYWHRDSGSTSNFSSGLELIFQ